MMTVIASEASDAPLLVIGAGIGRTGTLSLKMALEIIFKTPCYHMDLIITKHPEHVRIWSDLFDLIKRDPEANLPEDVVREIFRGYQATTDNPGCTIYKQLMKIYPQAKVILTTRDPQTWIQSVRATVRPKKPIFQPGFLGSLKARLMFPAGFPHMLDQTLSLSLGQDVDFDDDEQMIRGFIRWNEEVTRVVPADRLLVFRVKDGWEPLCQFLNKPIPQEPFPHVNDRGEMQRRIAKFQKKFIIFLGSNILVLGLGLALGIWWSRTRNS
ncbi:Sulfotransferase family protein [Fasciolopsis buskii]|uniref:Sulfotransferase family protein n=1 Tax=Fasciolopsis buskii TaxID=27845 RepID=A0A8E0RTU2_9TREM|nr:Sulfotransferase family protein [Fasciolopsis buski]